MSGSRSSASSSMCSFHKLNEHIELGALERLPLIYLDTLRALLP